MDICSQAGEISAFHDGELSGERLAAAERHLAECAVCRADLARLRRLSRLLGDAPMPTLSPAGRRRLYELAPAFTQRVYLRLAEWTTALAASVVIACSLWIIHGNSAQAGSEQASNWPLIALNPPQEHDVTDMPEEPQFVDWVTTNVTAGQNP